MSEGEKPDDILGQINQIFTGPAFQAKPIFPPGLMDSIANLQPSPLEYEMPKIDLSNSPHWRAADAAEETAEATAEMRTQIEAMVHLTARNVQMAEAAREDAARTERFSRGMAWTSTVIAVASLVVAAVALFASL
ncbi:hypothetical protein LVJ59_16300 [Microbacterium sp. KKR3/1]|uniref:hypothetical protein n=1 Tax=Microbacterium sp. KKR3/1 TaxID=2904241 RepID=UPI001E3B940C|nr:hypothetical protein [Microbacterium sp. KKR3/1]MCE0510611.1 hypothetical protein [Microbacterium sp. KKR3/1]